MRQSTNRRIQNLVELTASEHLTVDLLREEIGITHWELENFAVCHTSPPNIDLTATGAGFDSELAGERAPGRACNCEVPRPRTYMHRPSLWLFRSGEVSTDIVYSLKVFPLPALRATAGAPAFQAAIAGTISDHQRATDLACRRISQSDNIA